VADVSDLSYSLEAKWIKRSVSEFVCRDSVADYHGYARASERSANTVFQY
jgi:hypothetical protein